MHRCFLEESKKRFATSLRWREPALYDLLKDANGFEDPHETTAFV